MGCGGRVAEGEGAVRADEAKQERPEGRGEDCGQLRLCFRLKMTLFFFLFFVENC